MSQGAIGQQNHDGIRVVCFDLGGVLVRICRSWSEGCQRAGIEKRLDDNPTPEQQQQLVEVSVQHVTGRCDTRGFAEACRRIFAYRLTVEEIIAIDNAWIQEEYEGVEQLIQRLAATPYELALLSNTTESHWKRLLEYPAIQHIPHRFTSFEMQLHKPDPAIYHAFEAGVGCHSHEILFFDDLAPNVESARTCGWRAEQIDPHQPTAPQLRRHLQQYGIDA